MKNLPFTTRLTSRHGFTLVEIMIAVAIIILLTLIALPNLVRARKTAQITRLAIQFRTMSDAITTYASDNDKLPMQNPGTGMTQSPAGQAPPGMATYMPQGSTWTKSIDGTWYWIYWPDALPGFRGFIFLYNPTLTPDDLALLDKQIDNGDLNSGSVVRYMDQGVTFGVQ